MQVRELQANLEVGDKVVTSAGLYGQITEIADASVQLEVADGVIVKVSRAAISQNQEDIPQPEVTQEDESEIA